METLRREVDECREYLGKVLLAHLDESRGRLKRFLVEDLNRRADGSSQSTLFDADVCQPYVSKEVERIIGRMGFPKAQEVIEGLECHYHILDLSEQVLRQERFQRLVEERFGASLEQLANAETSAPPDARDAT